ncbi:nuclear transport factor 2 family protein [Nocardia nepalensis]|uniref:nuclear transport factor 2 family protein n=1 Tax=Nocardia nepalensis TaxID=3375448 RepID=UPI003B682255
MTTSDFDTRYLRTWTEPDPRIRRANIDRLWAADGRMAISSLGITIEGIDGIAAHITRVHEENIAGKGLTFTYDQDIESGDALLLRWSMLTPRGETVGRGVDVVFRDPNGLVKTVYMFMGVN